MQRGRRFSTLLAAGAWIALSAATATAQYNGLNDPATGEITDADLEQSFRDLRAVGVDFLTLGQYLRPTNDHLPVERFVTPMEFEEWRDRALKFGFKYVASGPLVRSSYRAGEFYLASLIRESSGEEKK